MQKIISESSLLKIINLQYFSKVSLTACRKILKEGVFTLNGKCWNVTYCMTLSTWSVTPGQSAVPTLKATATTGLSLARFMEIVKFPWLLLSGLQKGPWNSRWQMSIQSDLPGQPVSVTSSTVQFTGVSTVQ